MFKTFALSFFVLFSLQAEEKFFFKGNIYKKIYQYLDIHKQFSKKVCTPGLEFKYQKLLRENRGNGLYIPMLGQKIDRYAIKKNLKHFLKKESHIKKIIKRLKKKRSLKDVRKPIAKIEETISDILKSKEKGKEFKKEFEKLKSQVRLLLDDIYYLKSYNFPNNHTQNRIKYDKATVKQQRNIFFFYRKIVEDGAFDKSHKRSDLYLRSSLDTIWLNFLKGEFSENLRYDLVWSLSRIEKMYKRGYKKQIERMEEWLERTRKKHKDYKEIVGMSYAKEKELLKAKEQATANLKKFTYQKQAEAFEFWTKQKPLFKALFSLETILFNEVGTVDGKEGLERRDVARLTLNRFKDKALNRINKDQDLTAFLSSKTKWKDETLLGTLFKKGEFSFTYYYIPSVVKIFCPDMTRRGRKLRSENLKISLKEIQNYKYDFLASRYFSRVSMLGKVDMAEVWTDYKKYPHRPGLKVQKASRLLRAYRQGKYQFFYSFLSPDGSKHDVVSIKDRVYSVRKNKKSLEFYSYRDPNLFTYFTKK